MDTPVAVEQIRVPEKLPLREKTGRFISRLGLAAMCILPMADLALSDAVGVKVLDTIQDSVSMESETLERTTEMSLVAGEIMAESMALGYLVSRSKRLRGVFGEFDEYVEEKQKKMHLPHKILSKVAHTPYKALEKLGTWSEKAGEKVSHRKSKVARNIGKLLIDAGRVNALGTTNVIMQETMAGKPPTLKRNAEIAGLITISWIGAAELIRGIYRSVDFLRPPMAAIGETFVELTSIDVANPLNTPTATAFLGSIATGLAVSGWNMAKFHEQRQQINEAQN